MKTLLRLTVIYLIIPCITSCNNYGGYSNSSKLSISFNYSKYEFSSFGVKKLTLQGYPNISYSLENVDDGEVPKLEYLKMNYDNNYRVKDMYLKVTGQTPQRFDVHFTRDHALYETEETWSIYGNGNGVTGGCRNIHPIVRDYIHTKASMKYSTHLNKNKSKDYDSMSNEQRVRASLEATLSRDPRDRYRFIDEEFRKTNFSTVCSNIREDLNDCWIFDFYCIRYKNEWYIYPVRKTTSL